MFNLLAQVTYTYTTTTTNADKGIIAGILGMMVAMMVVIIPIAIFGIICMWKVFEKAGVEGWKSIIPVYNMWCLAEISGKPGWWALIYLLCFIPIVNIFASIAALVLYVIVAIELAKSFGKEPVFALLLIFLNIIGLAMLAFGDAKYVGPGGKKGGSKTGSAKPAAA